MINKPVRVLCTCFLIVVKYIKFDFKKKKKKGNA